MKHRFGKSFVLIPIGLFLISIALIFLVTLKMPDSMVGVVMGIGIGLTSLPFIKMRLEANKV